MMLYQCELKKDGIVYARFFQLGDAPDAIRENLDMFQWPGAPSDAEWDVFPPPEDETVE